MFDFLKRWSRTEHEVCQDGMSAFLDGQLTPGERSRVEKHLQECEACRTELDSLRHTVSLLRAAPVLKPPRLFFIPAGEVTKQRLVRRRRLSYGFLQAATTVATVLLVLVVSGDALMRFQPAAPALRTSKVGTVATVAVSQGMPTVTVPSESSEAAEFGQDAAAAEQPPEAAPTQVPTESLDTGETLQIETTEAVLERQAGQGQPVVLPSRTFSRPAGAPAPQTLVAEAKPATALPTGAATATPLPTNTPIPPTATPPPTLTPPPPTPTPPPQPATGETDEPLPPPSSSGSRAFLEGLGPFLPWIEGILALTVALLLVATLWLRRRLRMT